MTWTHRGLVTAAAFALLLASCSATHAEEGQEASPVQAQGQAAPPESFTDPDDVNLALDMRTLTQESTPADITYTVETYEPFKDTQADFAWAIDKNNDGIVDNYVSVEWEGNKLEGKFEDTKENDLANAAVTRPSPHSLRVSFPRKLIGTAYQYRVTALTDLNGNDEEDPGETDVAPDSGFHPHRL